MQAVFIAGPAGTLQFQVIAVRVQVHPVFGTLTSQFRLACQQSLAHVPPLGPGQGNQTRRPGFLPFLADNRLAVTLAFGIAEGDDFGEVEVTVVVAAQQGQAERVFPLIRVFQPQVRTDDRFYAGAHGGLVEGHQGTHVGLFGQADGGHAQLRHAADQRLDPNQAIHHGIFGMYAQVNESVCHGQLPINVRMSSSVCGPNRVSTRLPEGSTINVAGKPTGIFQPNSGPGSWPSIRNSMPISSPSCSRAVPVTPSKFTPSTEMSGALSSSFSSGISSRHGLHHSAQ